MAERFASALALALGVAACSSDPGVETTNPDAMSSMCTTSPPCGTGNWCNPNTMLCVPRGTTIQFDTDIYPELQTVCSSCHVAGVADSKGGTISVFAGGPDVAYASLVAGGTTCGVTTTHKICVNEPPSSLDVVRLLTHAGATSAQTLLLPQKYADPWMQKFLHWIAAGARRTNIGPDGGTPDAPLIDAPVIATPDGAVVPDALVVPDAPIVPDAAPVFDARTFPDATMPPGQPTITSPAGGSTTGPGQIPVIWLAPSGNGNPITQYVIIAHPSAGAEKTVTCNAPFASSPCTVNANQTLSTNITGLVNCTAYNVTVTATTAGGSATSTPIVDVTPIKAPTAPTSPSVTKVAGVVGDLLFSWTASDGNTCGAVSYQVEVDPPSDVSCGNAVGAACVANVGTATSFDMTTQAAACDYPNVNCGNPRVWAFRVRGSNGGGTSGFTAGVSGTPRVGYVRDGIPGIWTTEFANEACADFCHSANSGNPLLLAGTAATTYNSIVGNLDPIVILGPPPNSDGSYLHLCPTNTAGCLGNFDPPTQFSPHPGGLRFSAGSLADQAIVQWIKDGGLF